MITDEKRAEIFDKAYSITDKLKSEVGKVISGKERETELLICAMIAGGHVLIEDVPGVGKTTLATALAKAAGLSFRRAQFTPDVMASDITGFNVYNRKTEFITHSTNIVLVVINVITATKRQCPVAFPIKRLFSIETYGKIVFAIDILFSYAHFSGPWVC